MASQTIANSNSDAYVESIRGLLRLHELTENGQDDSPEADAIRDALERPWHELSDIEKTRITGLSEDLYSISDPFPFPGRMPTSPAAEQGRLDAIAASQAGDPDSALALLRHWGRHLDPASLSFERGCVWVEAGDSETAKPFLEHAAKLDPNHGSVFYLYLSALNKSQPIVAVSKSREIVSEPDRYPALGVVKAAEILGDSSLHMPENEARPLLRQLIQGLVVALNKVQASIDKQGSLFVPTHSSIRKSLGYCYFRMGDNRAAIEHFNAGLALDPENDSLLLAHGSVHYAADSHAIADFQRALSRDSKSVWPYFYLAHYYLVGNNFDECRRMCERTVNLGTPNEVKAHLNEWLAISNAELGSPEELIRDEFVNAIRLAPSVEHFKQNLEKFELDSSARGRLRRPWVKPSGFAVHALGPKLSFDDDRLIRSRAC